MNTTGVKATIAKGLTVGLIAGAFMLAAPAKASAQNWSVGVAVGSPYYHDDGRREYYEHAREEQAEAYARQQAYLQHEAWERHEARERHEAEERREAYGRYGYGYRDRDDHRDWDRR